MDKFNLSIDLGSFRDQIHSEIKSHIQRNMRGIIAEYFQAPGTWKNAQAGYGYMCIQKALDDIMDGEEFQVELRHQCNEAMQIALKDAIALAAERSAKKMAFTTIKKPLCIGDVATNNIDIYTMNTQHAPGQQFKITSVTIKENGIFYSLYDFCGDTINDISGDFLDKVE